MISGDDTERRRISSSSASRRIEASAPVSSTTSRASRRPSARNRGGGMAGLGKGENSGCSSSGSGGGQMGFRFKPREAEVVEYYLLPRLQGRTPVPNAAIVVENVYKFEPERLINEKCNGGGDDEEGWYFLSPRDRKYRNGKRPSRSTEDKAGRWKASTGKTEAKETGCYGGVKFCVTSLVYFRGPVKTEKKTKWLMREFTIPQFENKLDKTAAAAGGGSSNQLQLDQYVLCKIYTSPKKGADDGEPVEVVHCGDEDIDGWAEACAVFDLGPETAESGGDGAAASGGNETAAGDMLSAQQAGKRLVEAAAVAEQPSKRPWLPPPTSTPAHGTCDGGPSQAMGNRQVPMQGLSLMHNFPPPPAAAATYNGHQQPLPTTFRGHAPLQQGFPVHNNQAQMRWLPMRNCMPSPEHNIQPQPVQPRRAVHGGQAPLHNNYQALPPQPVQRRAVHVGGHAPMHQTQWTPVRNAQAPMQQLPLPLPGRYEFDGGEPMLPFDDWLFDPFDDSQPQAPMQQLPVMMNNHQPQAPRQLPPMMNNDQPAMMHGGEVQAPMQKLPVMNNDQPATTHGGEVQAPMPLHVSEEEQRPSQED